MTDPLAYQTPPAPGRSGTRLAAAILSISLGALEVLLSLCGLIGVIFGGAALTAAFSSRAGGADGAGGVFAGAMIVAGCMMVVFLAVGVLYILCGIKILNKNPTWELVTLILASVNELIVLLLCGCAAFGAVAGSNGVRQPISGIIINFCMYSLLIAALGALIYLLIRLRSEPS